MGFYPVFRRHMRQLACTIAGLALATVSPANAQSLLRDAEIDEWLEDYSQPILEAAGIPPSRIEILLIGDPTFNAFAGGRYMGYHTGLLTSASTPNEIEAVIAHEVGHIAGGHTARSDDAIAAATRPMLLSLVLAAGAIAAGAPQAGFGLLGLGQTIGTANFLKYSRSQEASADQLSIRYLEKLGKSGAGAIEIWQDRMGEQIVRGRKVNPYRQTHPLPTARVEALRTKIEASPYFNTRDSEEEIHRLKMIQAKINGFMQEPKYTFRQYPETDKSDTALYARAVAYYRAADIDKALTEINSLLATYPDNPFFHELKGQMLFEFGRIDAAIPPHRESVRLSPDEPLLRINLGRALLSKEDLAIVDEAISELKTALAMEPDNSFAWFELSRAYGLKGDLPLAHLATAESKYHARQVGEAAQFAQRALKGLRPGTPEHRQALDILTAAQNVAAKKRGRR